MHGVSAPSKASPIASAAASLLRGADLVASGAEGLGEGDVVVVPQVTPDVRPYFSSCWNATMVIDRPDGGRAASG
ncbi:MAG: hypothetical protein QOI36_3825 [Pseudonocardiales bacterium]|nr:hypothetical protein [Pseudonocardiales bacterium]